MDDEIAYLDNEDAMDHSEANEEQEEMADDASNVPYRKKLETLYTLFNRVWKAEKNSKIGNLNNVELGKSNMSIRDAHHLAMLSNTFHHPKFASYFGGYAEIVSSTSMAKKGWFVELFVSQKKFTSRASAIQTAQATEAKKRWIFGKKTAQPENLP